MNNVGLQYMWQYIILFTLFIGLAILIHCLSGMKYKYHVLISAQCSPYQDWQVATVWWSIQNRWSDVYATRLLSCNPDEQKNYKYKDIMPTIYTPNWAYHPKTGEWYQPYNRPVALVEFFKNHTPQAPWVVLLDPDQIIRRPMSDLPVKRGTAVAQEASFMNEGIKKLASKWCKKPHLVQGVSVPIIIHWKDLKEIAPLWLKYTERLRQNNEAKAVVDWMAEMYGYAFAAADLGITHIVRNDLGDRPPYIYAHNPYTLHFDIDHEAGGGFKWNKRDYLTKDMMNNKELMPIPKKPPNSKFAEVFFCINKALGDVRPKLIANRTSSTTRHNNKK